ncbi:hypothetical protein [Desertimonas flava]|jgi:hypothetical protein|uniref:hypothetical protein n=1 Tax=Desertimonas flava TaxID=2064846 RepID=UPI000E34B0F1|nr:hypothetical protein [Desertimonas flava]
MRKSSASALIALATIGVTAAATSVDAASVGSVPPDSIADEPATTEPDTLATVADGAGDVATVELAPGTEAGDIAAVVPTGFEPVVVLDRNGAQLAAMTVVEVEEAWSGHDESWGPSAGNEYTRVTVSIESLIPRGVFEYSYYDFVAQDADGFELRADDIDPSGGENPTQDGSLVAGETAEVVLTFEGLVGAPVVQVFYAPSDRLVTIAEL